MNYEELSCNDFIHVLASNSPVPGGGGAAALVGAIGMALGNMVGSLTVGKKKYEAAEAEMIMLKEKADRLQQELLHLINKDAELFEPLSRAYRLPKDTEEEKALKAGIMEKALRDACTVPLAIMEKCCEAIDLLGDFTKKGSSLAVSDAGCGAACCRAALQSAGLNVFINTRLMADRSFADEINERANKLLDDYVKQADEIFMGILKSF